MVTLATQLATTTVYEQLAQAWIEGKRHVWLEGGTAASKTFSVIQLLILIAENAKSPLIISIISESIPHLKRGCLRDFKKILGETYEDEKFNMTNLIYTFPNVLFEFFSADDPSKQRGARRDIMFINEANNIPKEAFYELDSRTRIFTICDWNPTNEFWYHQDKLIDLPDSLYIHATYKDALNVISPETIKTIEELGSKDPNWWNIFGLGLMGKIEGLVYPKFEQCESLPDGTVFYGLDFGFTNDPAVLVKNVIIGGNLYSQELFYERGLTNDDIARKMNLLKVSGTIWADSAEPKSIEELVRKGFNVQPSEKGPGSVEFGHQRVNQYYQFWTKDSVNCIREQRNFRYKRNIQGMLTAQTTHEYSHGMDSRRYGVASYQKTSNVNPLSNFKMPRL